VPIEPLGDGSLPSEQLGLRLIVNNKAIEYVSGPWLRWIDEQGTILPAAPELVAAEKQRADQQAQRANQETQRADQETQRADQETQRAEQEAQRAEQEAQRALELAEKLAAYEAKFGKLE
jgi:phage-related minor tail protein